MEVCRAVVGELLSSARTLAQLLWDACQLCIASIMATLLALLRLSETLRLARLSAALTEASKPPARPVSAAPLALRCSHSNSALHKLLLPSRLGAPHRLTVVLDVDETLVCAFKPSKVPPALHGRGTFSLSVGGGGRLVIFQRPGLNEFLLRLSSFAEIVAFTAGMQGYAEPLLDALDPERRFFSCRLYREATSSVRGRDNVKDLGRLNRDLARVVLVDDNAWSFLLQPANGVPAVPYLGSPHDGHLLGVILPLLEALSRARDVRPVLHATFDMAGWFGRRGMCMYERHDRTLTAAAALAH